MSRGTRIGGDVMGLYPFREKYSFPAGYCRTGRVGVLNRRLLDLYGSIGNAGNRMAKNRRRERHCTPLYLGKHWASELDSLQESTKELITDRHDFGYTATFLIAELEALGHQAYIPEEMVEFVRRPDPLVPFGSLSYLEKSPHYFTPEKYSVPEGLPTGYTDGYIGSVCDIGDANTCLERKYGVIARHLNRIRFFCDCRVRLGKSPADYVPGNSLTREVISCRHQFDKATILIKQYQGEPKLFTMPSELRDKVMEDYAVMSLEPLGDVSCLFPGDSQENYGASEDGAKLFLLYESASGYALFHIDGGQGMDTAFADYGSFRQTVRLTVYYPFPSTADAHKQYNAISKGIMTDELRSILACFLPDPTRGAQFNLGVIDPKLGGVISDETGITCRSDIIVDELFRGIRLYFNCFVELEGSDVDKFQLRLGHICSRDTANFNVYDMMIVQAISQLDTLDKNISYYSVRVRKCLSVRFPELMNIVEDNHIYAQLAQLIIKKPDLAE